MRARHIVAETRRIQGQLHEAVKRQITTLRVKLSGDARDKLA